MKLRPFVALKSNFIKPCSKILSKFFHKLDRRRRSFSLKPSRFRRHRHRRFRTKVVRFRKPFSLSSLRLPRPKTTGLRFRRRLPKARIPKARIPKARIPKARIPKNRLRFRRSRPSRRPPPPNGERFGEKIGQLMSVFRSSKRSKELEQVMELHSVSDTGNGNASGKEPFPSPVTPAFVSRDSVTNAGSSSKKSTDNDDDDHNTEEDACRSFESYLAEMIVEDGKLKDLKDVEELLYCWRSLKSPVFVDLVCRFYGEVCKDLFEEEDTTTSAD